MVQSAGYLLEVYLDHARVADWERYPFNIPVIRHLERFKLDPKVTIFVGENGTGKSTLIEAIAINAGFNPEGGDKHLRFSTQRTESPLCEALRLSRGPRREQDGFFLRAESFYNVASALDAAGAVRYGGTSLHAMSHGESFLALVEHRFEANSLYIFDEPEAALSPQRQLVLLAHIHRLAERERCQFVIATHSPILLGYPGALIYELEDEAVRKVKYEETSHFLVTRRFLTDRSRFLERLLAEDE
ncbi:MAG: AAA family ATPase [Myxococcota bacterium]